MNCYYCENYELNSARNGVFVFTFVSKSVFCIRLRLRILVLDAVDSDTDLGLVIFHMHCFHMCGWIRKFHFVLSLCISADLGGQSRFVVLWLFRFHSQLLGISYEVGNSPFEGSRFARFAHNAVHASREIGLV